MYAQGWMDASQGRRWNFGKRSFWSKFWFDTKSPIYKEWGFQRYAQFLEIPNKNKKKVLCLLGKNHIPYCQKAKSLECSLWVGMESSSLPPPTHEVLSEPPLCMRTCLRGRHTIDHEGSYLSPWIGGPWTLQGRLVVRANSMVDRWRFRWDILLVDCYATRGRVGHEFRGSVVLLKLREP